MDENAPGLSAFGCPKHLDGKFGWQGQVSVSISGARRRTEQMSARREQVTLP
jgi:hypothetical protein